MPAGSILPGNPNRTFIKWIATTILTLRRKSKKSERKIREQENGDASEVTCDTDHDGVVESLLIADELCPTDAEPHRDSQGLGVACIRFDI